MNKPTAIAAILVLVVTFAVAANAQAPRDVSAWKNATPEQPAAVLVHIRVIYYDVMDPFWGQKLLDKVAENILSAIKNPEEAIFKKALEPS